MADGLTIGSPKKSFETVSSRDACEDSVGATIWAKGAKEGESEETGGCEKCAACLFACGRMRKCTSGLNVEGTGGGAVFGF